jgi:hypothetical protein
MLGFPRGRVDGTTVEELPDLPFLAAHPIEPPRSPEDETQRRGARDRRIHELAVEPTGSAVLPRDASHKSTVTR